MARKFLSLAIFSIVVSALAGVFPRTAIIQAAASSSNTPDQYKGTMVDQQVQLISQMSIEMVTGPWPFYRRDGPG